MHDYVKSILSLFKNEQYKQTYNRCLECNASQFSSYDKVLLFSIAAQSARKIGDNRAAIDNFQSAIQLAETKEFTELSDAQYITLQSLYLKALIDSADIEKENGNIDSELSNRSKLIKIYKDSFENKDVTDVDVVMMWFSQLDQYGAALYLKGMYEESLNLYRMQCDLAESQPSIGEDDRIRAYSNLCLTLCKLGKTDEGVRYGGKAIALSQHKGEEILADRIRKINQYLKLADDAQFPQPATDRLATKTEPSYTEADTATCDTELLGIDSRSIFISSTFKDMQNERDVLQLDVLPTLRREAAKYGETVNLIDLRWGVSTTDMDEKEGNKKVLDVCFSEIDNSRPYLLCLLGERYGWIPDNAQELVDKKVYAELTEATCGTPLEGKELSVTAMEMVYGALTKRSDPDRLLICIRDQIISSSDTANTCVVDKAEETSILKKCLESRFPDQVMHYYSKWNKDRNLYELFESDSDIPFSEAVSERIKNRFSPEWQAKSKMSKEQLLTIKAKIFGNKAAKKRIYQESQNEWLDALCEQIATDDDAKIVIRGTGFSGKTILSASLIDKLQAEKNYEVITFYSGTVVGMESFDQLQAYIRQRLRSLLEESGISLLVIKSCSLTELAELYRIETGKKLIILIDSYEKLLSAPATIAGALDKLGELNSNIILTCSMDTPLGNLKQRVSETYYPEFRQVGALAKALLAQQGKSLNETVATYLEERCQKVDDPCLYTHITAARLLAVNGKTLAQLENNDDIEKKLISIIADTPYNISEAIGCLIDDSRRSNDPTFVNILLASLSVSHFGLSKQDFEDICFILDQTWNELDYSRAIGFFASILEESETGNIRYSSPKVIRAVLDSRRVDSCLETARNAVLAHLLALPKKTPTRQEGIVDAIFATRNKAALLDLFGNWKDYTDSALGLLEKIVYSCSNNDAAWMNYVITESNVGDLSRSALSFLGFAVKMMGECNWYKGLDDPGEFNRTVLNAIERAQEDGIDLEFMKKTIADVREAVAYSTLDDKHSNEGIEAADHLIESSRQNEFNYVRAIGAKGIALTKKHDFNSARTIFLQELNAAEKLMKENHPRGKLLVGESLVDLGKNEAFDKQYQEAVMYFDKANHILEECLSVEENMALPPLVQSNEFLGTILKYNLGRNLASIPANTSAVEYATQWMSIDGISKNKLKTRRNAAMAIIDAFTLEKEYEQCLEYIEIAFRDNNTLSSMQSNDTEGIEECSVFYDRLIERIRENPEVEATRYEMLWRNRVVQSDNQFEKTIFKLPHLSAKLIPRALASAEYLIDVLQNVSVRDEYSVVHKGYVSDTIFNRRHGYDVYATDNGLQVYSLDCNKKSHRTGANLKCSSIYDAGVQSILENGYPARSWFNTANDFIATQTALWWYMMDLPLDYYDEIAAKTDIYNLINNHVKTLVSQARKVSSDFSIMTTEEKTAFIQKRENSIAVILEPNDVRYERMAILLGDDGHIDHKMKYWRDSLKPLSFDFANIHIMNTGKDEANIRDEHNG